MRTFSEISIRILAVAYVAAAVISTAASAATFTVNSPFDSGAGTLRQAVLDANANPGADTINFDASVFDGTPTIAFLTGEMNITGPLTMDGPPNRVVLSGNGNNRMFNIDDGNLGTAIAVIFRKVRFFSGRATGNFRGGAFTAADENVSLIDCQVSNNSATDSGGAIFFAGPGSSLSLTRCLVSFNTSAAGGGAIAAFGSLTLNITDSTFQDNHAVSGGAINQSAGGSMLVQSSAFFNNIANPFHGGVILLNSGFSSAIVRNSTMTGNGAIGDGGAIALGAVFGANLQIENCTIVGNGANQHGGGISRLGGSSLITIRSTIFSGNGASVDGPTFWTSGTVNAAASLVESTVGATTFTADGFTNSHIGVNAMVSPLANNGGPTLTHLLQFGSPAIDNGTNPAALTTDQRGTGFNRVVDGDCNGMAIPDIGALEVHICNCPGDTNKNGIVDIDDLVQVISFWGYNGAPGGVLGDANNDGHVNIDDLVAVITGWGNCP